MAREATSIGEKTLTARELQQQGRDAYHEGKGFGDCPYDVHGNPMAHDVNNWLTGWWSEYYKANPQDGDAA